MRAGITGSTVVKTIISSYNKKFQYKKTVLWVALITKVIYTATLGSAKDVEKMFLIFRIRTSCYIWFPLSPTPLSEFDPQTPYLLQPP